ncbi:pyridoxamine 5'-phosphate oxidase family protein [Gilvimarinus xylanilyticus]|uniref:Pyridoxamine 5'-phosphate oxidase family protein n=1 Tax=Gilvimarinus xylanilyticus TaxID=2944139 RepID=A0A9X2KUD8_9GAMM|nr:pyridoxamine 5'-phosphate oxidase family protein [Gilvimarinus xylanilyticus]MCP8899728.1 pyridoxamine 5'-phosphate oxidase family protein [Gilvimarinus xylanilyticus]
MGRQYSEISEPLQTFIARQKMFFVATATDNSRVNVSPKGMDSLKVLGPNRVVWLNVTGSGNETAAHVRINPRMTIMFCAFEGAPMILRLYGQARVIHHGDSEWQSYYSHFTPLPGARQVFELDVDLVQASCGMAVPFFDYQGDRDQLKQWAEKKGDTGVRDYWANKNRQSIDGLETGIEPSLG